MKVVVFFHRQNKSPGGAVTRTSMATAFYVQALSDMKYEMIKPMFSMTTITLISLIMYRFSQEWIQSEPVVITDCLIGGSGMTVEALLQTL